MHVPVYARIQPYIHLLYTYILLLCILTSILWYTFSCYRCIFSLSIYLIYTFHICIWYISYIYISTCIYFVNIISFLCINPFIHTCYLSVLCIISFLCSSFPGISLFYIYPLISILLPILFLYSSLCILL